MKKTVLRSWFLFSRGGGKIVGSVLFVFRKADAKRRKRCTFRSSVFL
jgi:hypothetical protein